MNKAATNLLKFHKRKSRWLSPYVWSQASLVIALPLYLINQAQKMIGSWSCNHRGSLFHSYTEVATQKLAPRWWASWSSDDIFTVPLTSPFVVRASWPAGTGISQEKSNQPLDECQTVPMSVFPECGLSLKECDLQGFLRGHRPCRPYWISEGQRMS